MSTEDTKTVVHRYLEEAWSKGNLDAIDETMGPNYVGHTLPEVHGPEAEKRFVSMYRAAFPNLNFTIEDQIVEGDKVVTRWTASGTHQGDLQGIAATGKPVSVMGIFIHRFVEGKIVEGWGISDQLGMLQQLGVIPMPGQGG